MGFEVVIADAECTGETIPKLIYVRGDIRTFVQNGQIENLTGVAPPSYLSRTKERLSHIPLPK